jgi:hypothetical protein
MEADSSAELPRLESIFFLASEPVFAGTPLRIVVPAVPDADDWLLGAMRACAPRGDERRLPLGPDGPDAELALLDYWTDLPAAERSHVWGVMGALAGALMRFGDRPVASFALLGAPVSAAGRGRNPQARALLTSQYPDSWALALDEAPGEDADQWRFRLATVAQERWSIGLLDGRADVRSRFADALAVDASLMTSIQPSVMPAAREVHEDRSAGWLDVELHDRVSKTAGNHVEGLAAWGAPPAMAAEQDPVSPEAERKVLRGKRGRLFLAHDSHDSHRQIIGQRPLASADLDAWERGTASRMADLGSVGSLLIHVIGPAPQVVHSADLPDGVSVSSTRPVLQVLDRLGAMRPAPEVIYPLAELESVGALEDPFGKTDSHWNDLGAYIGYEALMAQLEHRVPARRLHRGDVSFQETCYVGDLGGKLHPQRAAKFLRARIERPRARLVEDNRVRNHGRVAIYECETAPATTCLVFGDSWAYPMLLYLAESFRRLVFFHRVNVMDRAPILRERPDVVVMVLTERFCSAIPNDDQAVPFDRVVAKKVRARDLVPETVPALHPHPFLHSVKLNRGLPDRDGFRLPPG